MYASFSGPLDWSDEADDIIGFIASEHLRLVGREFVERFEPLIQASSTGLHGYLSNAFDDDLTWADVWRPAFGLAKRAIRAPETPPDELIAVAAELAIGLAAARREKSEWSVSLRRPARFGIGNYAISIESDARFSFEGDRIEVERADHSPLLLKRSNGRLSLDGGATGIDKLLSLDAGRHRILFANSRYFEERDEGDLPFSVSDAGSLLESAWGSAYDLIRNASEPYDCWVSGAIHSIVPVKAPDGSMVSGSQGHRPGEVYMTDLLEPTKLAEMLVHESSHQYFQIANFLGPIANGADTELYYSPVVGTTRPIDKILLAYHAFANVILFLQICRDRGAGNPSFIESNLARLRREVDQLQEPLQSTGGLTEIGNGLWKPLAERLANVH